MSDQNHAPDVPAADEPASGEGPRELPESPSLRHLRLEAKRRLAAGEFPTLHDAQLAVAREHGMSSWTALKQHVEAEGEAAPAAGEAASEPVLRQLRWLFDRFGGADAPDWNAPDGTELAEHFAERFLTQVTPELMADRLAPRARFLREELVVSAAAPRYVRAQLGDLRVEAGVEAEPPQRLSTFRIFPTGQRVHDPRVAQPPTANLGSVPDHIPRFIERGSADLGLLGVIVAGDRDAGSTRETWTHTRGWADLNQGIAMRPEHRFPACTVTELVTSIAVLRLVDEGALTLDGRVNSRLRSLRLADDEVTVRQLLTHSGGVDGPESLWADAPVDPVELYGGVVGCGGTRGTFTYSRGGYAVLGRLVAELTGAAYAEAATRLVLEPLGMGDSSFPAELPEAASDADDGRVRGHRLNEEGTFEREPERHFVFQAAGGLWTTARDLLRLAVGWQRLLTEELAAEALRPQVRVGDRTSSIGLGWMLRPDLGFAGHNGHCPGSAVSLILKPDEARAGVVYTNRSVPIERVNAQIMRR